MVTEEIFENLKKLQEILVQKYELEAKVDGAPKQLVNQEDLLAKTQKEFIEQKNEFDEIQSKVLELKSEIDEAVKNREISEKGIADSTTHREYETLEKQITEFKNIEDEKRKELVREEKNLAEKNERLRNSEELIRFQEQELNSSKESLNQELSQYNEQLAQLKLEEDKITPSLDQEILFKFQRIIQRNSEGIVPVRNGVCTGCHMILPADFANEVREGENINFCPYCSRILFYEEVSEDQTEDYFDMGAAGSLAGFDEDFEDEDIDEDEDLEDENLYEDEDSDEIDDDDDLDDDDDSDED